MSSPKAAFKFALKIQSRDFQIEDLDTATIVDIQAAVSNYSRNLSANEEMIVEGREFVIDADELTTFGVPKRGHKIIDPLTGVVDTISFVRTMEIMGQVVGYRVRTS